jgi:hypothetical protein
MRTPARFVALVAALSGCGPGATKGPAHALPPGLEICLPHAGDDRLLGYCLAANAVNLRHLEVQIVCGQVTPHARECRHNWATARARWSHQTPLLHLLETCQGDSDCAFDVLDTRNPRDLVSTVGHCRTYVPDHIRDCVGHAVARWADQVASSEEITQITNADLGFDEMVGFHVATAVVCREIHGAICPSDGSLARSCRARAKQLRDQPGMCPKVPEHLQRRR